jgi:hypothetical protein
VWRLYFQFSGRVPWVENIIHHLAHVGKPLMGPVLSSMLHLEAD